MEVFIERTKQYKQVAFEGKASELLQKLSLQPEDVLLTKNGSLITEDEMLTDTDSIKILSVISGG